MSVDLELLKEVTRELWGSVKKLRPEIDRQARLQLVLKALITIGDLPDHMQAAMVVGICSEMDQSDNEDPLKSKHNINDQKDTIDNSSRRKVVRRSSAK